MGIVDEDATDDIIYGRTEKKLQVPRESGSLLSRMLTKAALPVGIPSKIETKVTMLLS